MPKNFSYSRTRKELSPWDQKKLQEVFDEEFPGAIVLEQLDDDALVPGLLVKRMGISGSIIAVQSFQHGKQVSLKWCVRNQQPILVRNEEKDWEIEFTDDYFTFNDKYFQDHVKDGWEKLDKALWFPYSDNTDECGWGRSSDYAGDMHLAVMWHVEYIRFGNTELCKQIKVMSDEMSVAQGYYKQHPL